MKRIICLFLSLITIMTMFTVPTFASNTVDVYINGVLLKTDQPALIKDGRTFVPLRPICEALNCDVEWDGNTETAQIFNQVTLVAIQKNNPYLTKIDREDVHQPEITTLDAVPYIEEDTGRILVPARAIAEALYAEVNWNGLLRRVDIELEYDYIGVFGSMPIAKVGKDGKIGYINKNRGVVIPLIYDETMYDRVGLIEVRKDGKSGYIDMNGRIVVPIKYDYLWSFSDVGLVAGKRGNKWGYVDLKGREVIPFVYDDAKPFSGGTALVERYGETFLIDVNGNEIK